MVDQKEEAKKEKFIEMMPTVIQTHLITCKDWATVKDTAKSLEHIILKCDPPTPAMPMMATGATIPGLYSNIAHLVDKEEGEIPQPFKGAKPKQPKVEENLKENLRNKDKTHQKPKRLMKPIHMKILTIIIITMPQVRVEATDLITVKAVTNNLEGSYNETEAKDLSMVNVSFKVITIREVYLNKTILNTAIIVYSIFREIKQIAIEAGPGPWTQQFRGCGRGRANYQNSNGMYQYQCYTHDPQPEQYGAPCSLCGGFNHSLKHCYKREHDINNIMEKMSINPHKSQQNNLYQ